MNPKQPTTNEINNEFEKLLRLLQPTHDNAIASEVPIRNGWLLRCIAAEVEELKTVNGVVAGSADTITNGDKGMRLALELQHRNTSGLLAQEIRSAALALKLSKLANWQEQSTNWVTL